MQKSVNNAQDSNTPMEKRQRAELIYVTAPDEEQLAGIRSFLAKEFHDENMEIELKEDASLRVVLFCASEQRNMTGASKGELTS